MPFMAGLKCIKTLEMPPFKLNLPVSREKRLKEMRDKLKAKQEHAEKVRRRKQLAPMDPDEKPPVAPKRFSEDAPIIASASVEVN